MIVDGKRALAYTVIVDAVDAIEGADNIALATVGGWKVIVKKEEFEPGDVAVFFEIDSKLPEINRYEFMARKHYKVKTMKLGKFNVVSQGLLMPLSEFPELGVPDKTDGGVIKVGYDLTDVLHITYAEAEDNKRKAAPNPNAKYQSMATRHKKIFRQKWARWMMRREWGRKVMFLIFGRKKDKPNAWPGHIASKTDVERIQNEIWRLADKRLYVATEKVDGSSFTAAAERDKWGRIKYYICSRNVVFTEDKDQCFYDTNVYREAFQKYNLEKILKDILDEYDLPNVAIQAEVFGTGIQKRDYSMDHHEMRVFHIVSNCVKYSMDKVVEICDKYGLPHVPVLDWNFVMPDTIEELTEYVEGTPSMIDDKEREGIVFYDKETGREYVKLVSPAFLMKYHG